MKFIISHKSIKRSIETPLALCFNSGDDLRIFAEELMNQAKTHDQGGWIKIDTDHPSDCLPNTIPLEWTESGNINPAYGGSGKGVNWGGRII